MAARLLLRSPPVRRVPLEPTNPHGIRRRCGEVAGGTAAECAAICCCCPCSVMNLLILAVYKVPAGLCKKAWNKKKRQRNLKRRNLLQQRANGATVSTQMMNDVSVQEKIGDSQHHQDAVDFEKEMWSRFSETGFWRSLSGIETQVNAKFSTGLQTKSQPGTSPVTCQWS